MSTGTDEAISEQFDVSPGSQLSIRNVSGRITVRGTDATQIHVRATKHGRESAVQDTRIEMTQDGNTVSVRTESDGDNWIKLGRHICSVEYDVEVPADCRVEARAVSARIAVSGLRNAVRLETVSGDLQLDDVHGDVSITSVSGDVEGRGLQGALTLHTTSGDVSIVDSRLPDFNCDTVSGDVAIETPLTRGEHYRAKTVSGDLHLSVPEGTGAMVQMKSVSGSVRSELPAEIIKSGRRHWQGRVNGGGANLEMNTVSGDLRISQSTRLTAETDTVGPSPTGEERSPGEDATTVLTQLERGEISVEDAVRRLKGVR